MRTINKYIQPAGLLLLAALLSTACADDTLPEHVDSQDQMQLGLSVGSKAATRMTPEATQADGTISVFRGISELHLLPFAVSSTADSPIAATDSRHAPDLLATQTVAARQIGDKATDLDAENQSKYWLGLSAAKGTNAFLVYAQATPLKADGTTTGVYGTDYQLDGGQLARFAKAANGVLNAVNINAAKPENIHFDLEPIAPTGGAKAQALVDYLNSIYDAAGTNWTNVNILSVPKDSLVLLTAGSSANVLAYVKHLYASLYPLRSNEVVGAVLNAISAGLSINGTDTTLQARLAGYPAEIGLPDGAAYVEWVPTLGTHGGNFQVVTSKDNMSAQNVFPLTSLAYPPSMWYLTNSRIHTSEQENLTTADIQTIFKVPATWEDVLSQTWEGYTLFTPNGYVSGGTTLVAINKPLQYGVGRLDVKVRAPASSVEDALGRSFDIENNFRITGVLVNGQKSADWQFHPTTGTDEYAVYDSQVAAGTYIPVNADAASTPVANRTLVMETEKDAPVIIALEVENCSGRDIYTHTRTDNKTNGTDPALSRHVIRNGTRFYLLAKLDPTTATGYVADDDVRSRTFAQDCVTTVDLTLTSLRNAYNAVPDLRSTELEFSLGVSPWKLATPIGLRVDAD